MTPRIRAGLVRVVRLLLVAGLLAGPATTLAEKAPVTLRHTSVESTERDRELVLRANIIAPAGAYLPTLYYRPVGESRYYSLPMLPVPGSINIYAASVPGIFVTKDIEYYLESYDTQLRGPGRAGEQKKPILVKVIDPVIPPSQVVIRSDPTEAEVFIDGKPQGKTPWLGVLAAGTHELILKKQGSLEAVSTLEVPENRDLEILRALPEAAQQAQFAVSSDPIGAIVKIDGQVLGETPLIAPSPDGEHTLSVEKQGYARAERTMLFSKDRSIETSFNMQRLPPEPALAVTSEPPGAVVVVDDKELGKTPFLGVVPTGEHTLVLKLEGRRTAQAQILMPEDRDLDLRFTLEEAKAKHEPVISINSDPVGATIFIDGKEIAEKTPYLGLLSPGNHTVKLSSAKYLPYERKIVMPETHDIEITLALVPEPPKPGPAKVTIDSDPAGVEVTVDGKVAGKSPVTVELAAGNHVAVAKADGFRNLEERFKVAQGETVKFKLALKALEKGVEDPLLSVRSEPDAAQLTVDGKVVGVTKGTEPLSIALKPGKHKLLVSRDGFKPREETFDLPADKTFELRYAFTLEPLRKSVQLQSAAEAKKAQPATPIVDTTQIQSANNPAPAKPKAAAPATPAASSGGGTPTANDLKAKAPPATRVVYAQPNVRLPPLVLAGAGVVLTGVGALFAISSMTTASNLTDPTIEVAARESIKKRHTTEVQATVGLTGLGVLMAAVGAVWASLPYGPDDEELPAEGSGGELPAVGVGLAPTAGGAAMSVAGQF